MNFRAASAVLRFLLLALGRRDDLLAATAAVNRLTLVTRNDVDVAGLGAKVFNPFRPR